MNKEQNINEPQNPAFLVAAVSSSCNTLHLNLHKKWFDMILSGEKKEEYRKMKPYFNLKFLASGKNYNTITFSNGYAKNRRQFVIELKAIQNGLGIEHWGAPLGVRVWILKLGNVVSCNNYC
jgi:hypothetical protein